MGASEWLCLRQDPELAGDRPMTAKGQLCAFADSPISGRKAPNSGH